MVAYLAISCRIRSDCAPDNPKSRLSAFFRAISPSLPPPDGVSVDFRSSSSSLAFICWKTYCIRTIRNIVCTIGVFRTCIVPGDPPLTKCLKSGGRMLSNIRFSCSFVALVGPRLLTTDEAGNNNYVHQ